MYRASTLPSVYVYDFHQKFNLPINDDSRTHNEMRAALIEEESAELIEAIRSDNKEHIAKELADMVFVIYGAAATLGIDIDLAVTKVYISNMTKLVDGKPLMREDGKVLKGPNYIAPDMADCI